MRYWHLGRPLIGAVLGIMPFLILSVIVALAGSNPPSPVVHNGAAATAMAKRTETEEVAVQAVRMAEARGV